ncbi:hypothetical protein R3P38DRAFT_3167172 [Favolaschia claudopus]|uniref:Uncharacterized protein n=1 Tax=Favolaschia claudopus TaxID=2862362 RepID=A0AAW0ECU9_9AGAR
MIIADGSGDRKGDSSAPDDAMNGEPSRAHSPPPSYVTATAAPIASPPTNLEQVPSAFMPPSPSSFPHQPQQTATSPPGPTPLFSPAGTRSTETYYPYYDPRSPYSLALADKRAWNRFWGAFMCNVGILVLLWILGFIQFGT